MPISISPESGKSLYEQIYEAIKSEIQLGELEAGSRLQSKRRLAESLKVSVITVENAYAQLAAEGYITAEERRGYFAAHVDAPSAPAKPYEKYMPEPEPRHYQVDFQSRSIRTEQFPFTVWARIMRSVILKQDTKLLELPQYNGVRELRSAISVHLRQNRGISASPEQIIVGAGSEYLEQLIIQLLGHEKVYAVEDPGYQKIAQIYEKNSVDCRHISFSGGALSMPELRSSGVDVVHISPSHHFPTGTVMPVSKRQELLRWSTESEGRFIIEDDYDSEFRFVGHPIQSLFALDGTGKVIYMNTFSKTIAPSMRISYMVLPVELLRKFRRELGFYACTVPSFEQYTLAEFISGGYFERHLNRMKKLYRQKRDSVIAAIKQSPLAEHSEIQEENAGLHFLLRLDTELSDNEIKTRMLDKGIRLSFLSDYQFHPRPDSAHILVISYSGIGTENLPEAFSQIADICCR